MNAKFEGWPHVVKTQQFSREWLESTLFPLADEEGRRFRMHDAGKPLVGKEMVSLFVGESLRTRARFEIAMKRGGGDVIFVSPDAKRTSSMAKGESLEDTIGILNEFGADVIVLRHDEEGGAARAAAVSEIPIINAGDGPGQHPTQAFLDLYTARKYFGKIDGLHFAMMGDLTGSRTIHSLIYLVSRYPGVRISLVSPENHRIGSNLIEHLEECRVVHRELRDIREVASEVDVFYQTRIQTNLGTQAWDRADVSQGFTIINKEVLDLAKKNAIIMHPLPCLNEIVRGEVDDDLRAVYIKTRGERISQVRCGLFITSALLRIILSQEA